ncbi:MAG TPA: hypothetical protein VFE33_32470 [Thermoanaerobaculia bacterium]|nr:hypothetical protein [Thermoanaerobaculia bacterium]
MSKTLPEADRGHLPARELKRVAASLDTAQAGMVLHALGCGRCAGLLLAGLRPRSSAPGMPEPLSAIDFREIWERASAPPSPPPRLPRLVALLERSAEQREQEVRRLAQGKPWVLAWALLDTARGEGDPARAEVLARLALVPIDAVPRRLYPPEQREDLRALVLAEIAETCRLQAHHDRAAAVLDAAGEALAKTSLEGEARATYCRRLGRLRQDQKRQEEALALFARSVALSEALGRIDLQAAALIDLGTLRLELGHLDQAAQTLGAAALLGPHGLAPGVVVHALEGMALALALHDQLEAARHALAFARRQSAGLPASIPRLDLVRLAGRLALYAGDLQEADELLSEAFSGFQELKAPEPGAVVGVELVGLALLRRRPTKLAPLTAALAQLHEVLPAASQAVLGGFVAALQAGAGSIERARAIADRLERLPWRRFWRLLEEKATP